MINKKYNKKTKKYNKKTKKYNKKTKKTFMYKAVGGTIDTKFLQCYDENIAKIEEAVSMYSGIHSINTTIAEEFINEQISEVRRQAARDLIENTIYITLEETCTIVEQLIVRLYTENDFTEKKIYLYVGEPTKSNYFLSVLALKYIRKNGFAEPIFLQSINFDIIGDNPLIILDDASYSGSQLSQTLNDIYFYEVAIKPEPKPSPPNIFILLTALNNISFNILSKVPTKNSATGRDGAPPKKGTGTYFGEIVSPFKLLFLPERLYEPLMLTIGLQRFFNLSVFFSIFTDGETSISMYLDHKLADDVSTFRFALTYGPIVPSNYNYTEIIKSSEMYDSDRLCMGLFYHFTPIEAESILKEYNQENNEEIVTVNYKTQIQICSRLLENLIRVDIIDKETDKLSGNIFKPFINTCNTSEQLIEIINDPEIKSCNYAILMVPNGCIERNTKNKCALSNTTTYVISYLLTLFQIPIELAKRINTQINSLRCPTSWYKKGELQMIC